MDKKAKILLAISVSAIILGSCTTSNTVGQTAQDTGLNDGDINNGVTHTHNGVAHTHRLPEGGLKHSHNIGTGNNRVCQPCGTNNRAATNTGGNCHTHAGRRHCHALPSTGTNHQHNIGTGPANNNNTFVNTTPLPPVNPQPQPQPQPPVNNNTTYYDYTDTGNSNYYNPAPTSKGAIPHQHNGNFHTHILPAAGINHTHSAGTSFGGSGSSSYYNSGTNYGGYTPPSYSAPTGNTPPPYSGGGGNFNDNASVGASGSCDTASGNYHIVQPKEGVYRIGVNNGVKRDDIIRLNNLQMPDYTIYPGQCLRLR